MMFRVRLLRQTSSQRILISLNIFEAIMTIS